MSVYGLGGSLSCRIHVCIRQTPSYKPTDCPTVFENGIESHLIVECVRHTASENSVSWWFGPSAVPEPVQLLVGVAL